VRMLPALLPATDLPAPEPGPKIALGAGELDLRPVWHDFAERPHLSVVGDSGSGKTAALRLIARAITAAHTPDEAPILVIDPRRGLLESIRDAYRNGLAVSSAAAEGLIKPLAELLRERVPGSDISPSQLRRRDWWHGPEYFVLDDDYDLLLT